MNKISYYANVVFGLPLLFIVCLMSNMYKLTLQAVRWSINETKDAYRSNRRAHKLVD